MSTPVHPVAMPLFVKVSERRQASLTHCLSKMVFFGLSTHPGQNLNEIVKEIKCDDCFDDNYEVLKNCCYAIRCVN